MTSLTTSPSIDQAALLIFENSFHELAQQTTTKLGNSPCVTYESPDGKTINRSRIGRMELAEVDSRNPDKQYADYAVDNRQFTKRRFTRTVTIDAKHDINELIKDPTNDILKQFDNAKNRTIDRVIIEAAVGSVLVGAPDAAPSSVTAANDGVITVDASSGLTYEKIQEVTENFINNDLQYSDFQNSMICGTGSENTDLMGEDEFINSDYISGKPVEDSVMMNAGTYGIVLFAGSKSGGISVTSPILPEGSTLRSCVVLAPGAVTVSMKLAALDVEKSFTKVNSYDITIDFWINAMRMEGVLVQIISTTI